MPDEWSMDRSDDRYVTNKITVNKVGSNGLMVVTTTNFNGRTGYGEIRTKILSEFDTTLVPSKGNAAPKATAGWDNKQEREVRRGKERSDELATQSQAPKTTHACNFVQDAPPP